MGRRKKQRTVSASALSQMGVCERLVVFEHFDGKHPTRVQQHALQRGLRAHRRYAAGRAPSEGRPEAQVLRRLQDSPHRPTRAGRRLSTCYRLVQLPCPRMRRSTTLHAAVLAGLLVLLWLAVAWLGTWGANLVR